MSDSLRTEISKVVGRARVIDGADVPPPPWDTNQPFRGDFVVAPGSTDEVSRVLTLCNSAGRPVVPMGGITGLVQGCATQKGDVGLSLERMNRIEELDPVAQTLTAGAGVTLRTAQQAATEAGLYFPVDIGARDNCMLGGNVATNAGGTRVIRYGMIRDSVLGLEAVLADGTVISSMNRYLKNNSGFDLKQLFIGTEGTLGVVTRVVVRLDVDPRSHNVALLGVTGFEQVLAILGRVRASLGAALCGFEVMWNSFYSRATLPGGPQPSPIGSDYPFYVIVEATGSKVETDDAAFESAMMEILESELAADGVIAKSAKEREGIWAIRHEVEWLVRDAFNFDVSLRVADVGPYVDELTARINGEFPKAFVAAFGHLGDNNVHISVLDGDEQAVQRHVYETLKPYEGAISAEHGIGLEKRPYLPVSRNAAEIELMKSLKRMMDPKGILNPGKVVET